MEVEVLEVEVDTLVEVEEVDIDVELEVDEVEIEVEVDELVEDVEVVVPADSSIVILGVTVYVIPVVAPFLRTLKSKVSVSATSAELIVRE